MATTWSSFHNGELGLRTGKISASQLHFYFLCISFFALTQPNKIFVCASAYSGFLVKSKGIIITAIFCTFPSSCGGVCLFVCFLNFIF